MTKIAPCLWFDGQAEEAAALYAGIFPDSHVDKVHRAPGDYPDGKAGDVLTVEFTGAGQPLSRAEWRAALHASTRRSRSWSIRRTRRRPTATGTR